MPLKLKSSIQNNTVLPKRIPSISYSSVSFIYDAVIRYYFLSKEQIVMHFFNLDAVVANILFLVQMY